MRFFTRWYVWLVVIAVAVFFIFSHLTKPKVKEQALDAVPVKRGNIEITIQVSGTVKSQNRLDIKPPLAGRAEEVLIDEGAVVKQGQILAWMSSNERSALLDAARAKGSNEMAYWKEVYKPTPLMAPLDGTIIVKKLLPGQSVLSSESVFVLSDRLIVEANLDETDIAKAFVDQKVTIILDGYRGEKMKGRVDQIAHDAVAVNNVTTYLVEIEFEEGVPEFVRSGMTASVVFLVADRKDVLVVPADAVREGKGKSTVQRLTEGGASNAVDTVTIQTGLSDGKQIEVLAGLKEGDRITRKVYQPAEEEKRMRILPQMPRRR